MDTNHSVNASLRRPRYENLRSEDGLFQDTKRIKLEDNDSVDIRWEQGDLRFVNNLPENLRTIKSEDLYSSAKTEPHDEIDDLSTSDGGLTPSPTWASEDVKSEYLGHSVLKAEPRDVKDDMLMSDNVLPRAEVLQVLNTCSTLSSICPSILDALRAAVARVEDEAISEAKLARKMADIRHFCERCSRDDSVISGIAKFRELASWFISIAVELGLSEDRRVDQAIVQDELTIIGKIVDVISDEDMHPDIYKLQGDIANCFLNALQEFLDRTGPFRHLLAQNNSHMCPNYGALHRAACQILLKLSSDSNTMPSSFFLKRIRPHSSQHPLGSGTFADVFQAEYDGQLVVLKRLRTFQSSGHRDIDHKSLCRESLPWRQLKHPRIVPFLGIDADSFAPCYCMVSPLIRNGNMLDYVKNHRHDENGYDGIDLVKLFADVADGLSYLHGQAVIHGDLRAENVLVDEGQRACISDFGLISFIETVDDSTTIRGNPRFMAPELLNGTQDQRTTASDIYSFASMCIQVMTGERPFKDVKVDGAVFYKVMQGEKPSRPDVRLFPPSIPADVFWDLLQACWSTSPDIRPTAQGLLDQLQKPANLVEYIANSPTNLLAAQAEGEMSPSDSATGIGSVKDDAVTCLWENCGRVYNHLSIMVEHIHNDHIGQRKSSYTCEWGTCNRRGLKQTSRSALITHVRSHTGEKPFICSLPECNQTFTRRDALTKHMRLQHNVAQSQSGGGSRKRKSDDMDAEIQREPSGEEDRPDYDGHQHPHHQQIQPSTIQEDLSLSKQSSPGPIYPLDDSKPTSMYDFSHFPSTNGQASQEHLVQYYMAGVIEVQYPFQSFSVSDVVLRIIHSSSLAHDAVCVLSSLYQRLRKGLRIPFESDQDLLLLTSRVRSTIQSSGGKHSLETAFSALQIISCILFAGGRGPWLEWLQIACSYASDLLKDPRFADPADVYRACDDISRFMIMTTTWFDVLAAATTMHEAQLIHMYRIVFEVVGILDREALGGSVSWHMLNVMGCENRTAFALAEISTLATWNMMPREGRSSWIHHKKNVIEQLLVTRGAASAYAHANDIISVCRRTTAAMFYASAKVYLYSVLYGDSPSCPEIQAAVLETIEWLRSMPPWAKWQIVGKTTFCICICGCLTDEPEQRAYLLGLLEERAAEVRVGTSEEVIKVMKMVWQRRDAGEVVAWRDILQGQTGSGDNGLLLI